MLVKEELSSLSKKKADLVVYLDAISQKEQEQLANKEALVLVSTRVVAELEALNSLKEDMFVLKLTGQQRLCFDC